MDAVKRLTEHFSAQEKILNDFHDAIRSRKRSVKSPFPFSFNQFSYSLQDTAMFLDAYVINVADQSSALIIFSNEEVSFSFRLLKMCSIWSWLEY